MKIALLTQSYPPMVSGAALFANRLADAMARRGHQVLVLAASEREGPYRVERAELTEVRLRSHHNPWRVGQRFMLWQNPQIDSALRRFEPDILHLHDPFQMAWAAISFSKRGGAPCIFTIHALPSLAAASLPPQYKEVENGLWVYAAWLLRQVQARVTPTRTIADLVHLRTGLSSQVISCGVDLHTFHPDRLLARQEAGLRLSLGIPDGVPVILHVGRLDADKKVDLAVMAAARAMQDTPVHLLVVGDGRKKDELLRLCHRLGIGSRSHFTGYITDPHRLAEMYRLANVFITASEIETQGLVFLEAAACGLPLVGVDGGAAAETVKDGLNGYLVACKDVDGMARGITRILLDGELAQRMGSASLEIAQGHDCELSMQAYEKLYHVQIAYKRAARNGRTVPACHPG
jgi:glycosyltransferase involved in cell wall biosynthesis